MFELALGAQQALANGAILGCAGYTIVFLVCTRLVLQLFCSNLEAPAYIRATRNMEDMVNLIWYGSLSCVSLYRLDLHEAWLENGYRYEAGEGHPNYAAMAMCGLQIGGYVAMSFLVWFNPKKRDAVTMCTHHIITSSIVALCAVGGYAHACMTILLLHDICDVPLLVMTLSGRNNWRFLEAMAYCFTVAAFMTARLGAFPFVTYVAASSNPLPMATAIISLNLLLWCMHFYWTVILLRQGYRRLRGLSTYDPREEPEPAKKNTDEKDDGDDDGDTEEEEKEESKEKEDAIEPTSSFVEEKKEEEPIAHRLRRRTAQKIN